MENYRISPKGKNALCEAVVVLTESQLEKLENSELLPRIEEVAKDLHVDFSVEKNGNVALCVIGTTQKWPVDSTDMHNAQINAINFMSAIDDLKIENDEDALAPENQELSKQKEFVQKLLRDLNLPKDDGDHVMGAIVVDVDAAKFGIMLPGMGWGHIGAVLLKEMCELYLEKHAQD